MLQELEFDKSNTMTRGYAYICKECHKKYRNKPKVKKHYKKYNKEWRRRPEAKLLHIKSKAKRKRNLGFDLLFDNPFKCKVEFHHISDAFVVAIPTFIHKQYYGNNHRERLKPIIEMLYNITYTISDINKQQQ